ncbi:Glutamate receptor 3.4 [Linum grandiflorum]
MTILAHRSDKVEFTQPFAESGLSMIVPAKSEKSAWMFMKPFTMEMWLVTGTILIYTMLIIWFLEHQTNPDFKVPLRNQMGTALLFTFSSLFFAHMVWLFVVLILNSSYTASLTSMLTVLQLKPNVTDIDWLRRNGRRVGCDGDSFVRNYLEKVLEFKVDNIENVDSEYRYEDEFNSNRISAAFMELPYQKVFINHYCKRFTATAQTFRFGGLGFVFQKGSPIAADVSKAILQLSEDGQLKKLEETWFAPSTECSSEEDGNPERLSLQNFWGLFVISSATSTVCLVICLWHLLSRKYREDEDQGDLSVWNKTVRLAKYLYYGKASIGRVSVMPTVMTPEDLRIPAAPV